MRPDLTTFLESPVLLRVVQQQPLPLEAIQAAIDQRVQPLGWTLAQRNHFIESMSEQSEASLSQGDWEL